MKPRKDWASATRRARAEREFAEQKARRKRRLAFFPDVSGLEDRTMLTKVNLTNLANGLGSILPSQSSLTQAFVNPASLPFVGQALKNLSVVQNLFNQFQQVEQAIKALPALDTTDADFVSQIDNVFTSVFTTGASPLSLGSLGKLSSSPVLVTPPSGPDNAFSVEMLLKTGTPTSVPVNLTLGLDNFLKITTTGSFSFGAQLDYLFKFNFDPVTSAASLDSTTDLSTVLAAPTVPTGDTPQTIPHTPMAVVASATPSAGFTATGVLAGLLQAQITNNNSQLLAIVGLGFDKSGNAMATFSADADLDVNLALSFAGALDVPLNPTLNTSAELDWSLTNIQLDSSNFNLFTPSANNVISTIQFGAVNLQIDVGVFAQLISTIQDFTEPLQPFITFLNTPLPGLSAIGLKVNMLDLLAGLAGDTSDLDTVKDAFDLISTIDALSIPANGTLSINNLITSFQISDPRGAPNIQPIPNSIKTGMTPDQVNSIVKVNAAASWLNPIDGNDDDDDDADGDSKPNFGQSQPFFQFPFLNDPSTVANLLTGQNVDLFKFTLPTITLGPEDIQIPIAPIIPGLVDIYLALGFKLTLALQFDYDTTGLEKLAVDLASGSTNYSATDDLLDGLKIPTDPKLTGLTLTGFIGIGAEAVIAQVEGDIDASISIHLEDPNDASDPFVRADQLVDRLSTGDLSSIFAVSGEIDLEFSIDIGLEVGFLHLTLFSIDIGPFVLYSFNPGAHTPGPSLTSVGTIYIDPGDYSGKTTVTQAYYPDPSGGDLYDKGILITYPNGSQEFNPFEQDTKTNGVYTFKAAAR